MPVALADGSVEYVARPATPPVSVLAKKFDDEKRKATTLFLPSALE